MLNFGLTGLRVVDPRFGEVTSGEAVALEPVLYERWLEELGRGEGEGARLARGAAALARELGL